MEKKIECKVGRKPAFTAQFSCNQPFLSPPWPSATITIITCILTIIPTSSSHQTISRGGCTSSLSSVKLFFSATATLGAATTTTTTRPKAFALPKGSQDNSSLLSRSNNSNCELPFSFANLYFFFFQLQPQPAAGLTTSSRTVCHQSGRQLPQRQISLPPLFFFFLPSLLLLHVNSAT
jgi:hypothetical protein